MKEISWRKIFDTHGRNVEYRVCSENISWRSAKNFTDIQSALFSDDGAYNMFHSYSGLRVEEQREKYGTPYFCAVWIAGSDDDSALLVDENEIALVSRAVILDIPNTSVYNFAKWDAAKRSKARIEAQQTKERLLRIFQRSRHRISLSVKAFSDLAFSARKSSPEGALDLTSSESTSDVVNDILTALNISTKVTETLSLAKSRVGQGVFRTKLIEYWGACSVTGCLSISLLKASHIKPWARSTDNERLDIYNGLLLVPGIDAAFDLGLVTFLPDGEGVISEQLSVNDRMYLGIYRPDLHLSKVVPSHKEYLCYHNDCVFESWKR